MPPVNDHQMADAQAYEQLVQTELCKQRNAVIDRCIEIAMAVAVEPMFREDPNHREHPVMTATKIAAAMQQLKCVESRT